MTTSSGKPTFEEQPVDTSGEAGDSETAGPDSSSREPPTPRQPARRSGASADGEAAPVYGAGVPYGGDDRTEEIDPIALDMPFGSDERKTPPAPAPSAMPVTPRVPSTAPVRNYEMAVPVKQLLLSDLFDSTPSSAALAPPDPAAFSSSRPPPVERPPEARPPEARPTTERPPEAPAALIAMPSIDVGSPKPGRSEPEGGARASQPAASPTPLLSPTGPQAPPRTAAPVRGPMPTPPRGPMPTPTPGRAPMPTPALTAAAPALPPLHEGPAPAASDPSEPTYDGAATQRIRPLNPDPSEGDEYDGTATQRFRPVNVAPSERDEIDFAATQRFRRGPPLPENGGAASPKAAAPAAAGGAPPAVTGSAAASTAGSSPTAASPAGSSTAVTSTVGVSPATASSPVASSPMASPSSSPVAAASPAAASPTPSAIAPGAADAAAPAAPGANESAPGEVVRFPSEVPTSRPPDVVLSPAVPAAAAASAPPGAAASPRPSQRPLREPAPAVAMVAAPVTSQAAKAQSNLPSIMLADDVEAEPDSSARRALRAARATVRLELPQNFGRPGSPVPGVSGASGSSPGHSIPGGPLTRGMSPPISFGPGAPAAPAGVGAFEQALPWFADPRTKRLLGLAAAAVVLLILLVLALSPRTGSLVVTALAPGNRAVEDVTIFIDGKPLCDVSPCRIKGLSPGVHTLRASAPSLASQEEETVEISAGDEATYNIDLLAVAPEVRAGAMRIRAAEVPLTLYVDGKRVGKLPQEVSGLSGGKHWIKLDPEDGSPAIEKSVNVLAGETVEIEPTPAKRDKALVTIRLARGSEGALVTFDDAFLLDFPAELELEPNTVHTLSATKPGFEDLNMEVRVDADETEKLIEVSLTPAEGSAPARKARPKVARKPAASKATAPASTALADPTQGLLNISSVPPSQIILNGRPLGSTPKTGITVPGDSLQTIVFVHPKMGRRRAQKFVPAGKERTVSIRF